MIKKNEYLQLFSMYFFYLQLNRAIAGNGISKHAPRKSANINPPMKIFVDDCRSFL